MRARQGRRAADLRDEFLPGFDYNLPRLIAEAGKPARPDLRTGVSLASAPQRDHLRVALRWELACRALTGIQHSDFASCPLAALCQPDSAPTLVIRRLIDRLRKAR